MRWLLISEQTLLGCLPRRRAESAGNACREIRRKICSAKPNIYKSRKNSQDAHEAIRPINLELTPESLKDKLQRNQYRLYKLIYERFLASQAAKAVYDSVNVTIKNGDYAFKSTGKTMTFDGYTRIYAAAPKEEAGEDNEKIPPLADGEKLELSKLSPEQNLPNRPRNIRRRV